jgi:hypothetical protein
MPFITEELWGEIAERPKMLVHADWPEYGAELIDAEADREMTWVIGLIEEIRSVRAQMHVPAGLKVQLMQAELDAAGQAAFDRNRAMIERLARLSEVTEVDALPKGAVTVAVEGGVFGLPIADLIDVDEEKARLEKVLEKLGKEIGGLKGRLSNPKFVESAPEEIVDETRENLAQREEEEGKIRAALDRSGRDRLTRGAPPARAAPVSARKTCVFRLRVCYATTMKPARHRALRRPRDAGTRARHPVRARLGANESVFGPSPKAMAAMQAPREAWMYGDPEAHDLRRRWPAHHGVPPTMWWARGSTGCWATSCG